MYQNFYSDALESKLAIKVTVNKTIVDVQTPIKPDISQIHIRMIIYELKECE